MPAESCAAMTATSTGAAVSAASTTATAPAAMTAAAGGNLTRACAACRRSASRTSGSRGEDRADKNQCSGEHNELGKHGISPNQPM